MSTATPRHPRHPRHADVLPHRFSTDEYLHMIQTGVLGTDDKVELIDGVICDMSPAGVHHAETLNRLAEHFRAVSDRYRLRIQGTTVIDSGQVFDPDLLLLINQSYWERHPNAGDIRLVAEVADSSLRRDLKVKGPIYAAAGIAEYWVADCEHRTLHVHRNPVGDRYDDVRQLTGDQAIAALAAPDLPLRVGSLFG